MSDLTTKTCTACEGNVQALSPDRIQHLLPEVPGWEAKEETTLSATFTFKNYYETTAFVNAVVWIAHTEDHHPDITFGYKSVLICYSTHSVGGLTENDFICAAKINALLPRQP